MTYGKNTGRWTLMYSAAAPSAITITHTSAQLHEKRRMAASVAEGRG